MAKKSFTSKLYSGSATFGRVIALVSAILISIIGIILIIWGIILEVHKTKLTQKTSGTVEIATCHQKIENKNIVYSCNLTIKYTVKGKKHTLNVENIESDSAYTDNDTIDVYYDPKNPNNGAINSDKYLHTMGIIMIICGIVMPLFAWGWWYLTTRSKAVAAAGGAAAGLDLLSGGKIGAIL